MVAQQGGQPLHVVAASPAASSQATANQLVMTAPACGHPHQGGVADRLVERARGVRDDEDLVALLEGRQGRERHADVGHHAGDDELLAARRLDRLDEVLVVPGVDLAGPRDERGVREQPPSAPA